MSTPLDLTKPAISLAPAVRFTWDEGASEARYVRAGEHHFVDPGDTGGEVLAFDPLPQLEYEWERPLGGGVQDNPLIVTISSSLPPASVCQFEPCSEVDVTVLDVDLLETEPQGRPVFRGILARSKYAPRGQSGLTELVVGGRRASWDSIPLGIRCVDKCAWTFMDPRTCGVSQSNIEDGRTISAISNRQITVDDLANGGTADYYFRGWVEYRGLRIGVRRHINSTTLALNFEPPTSWANALPITVRVAPGCDRLRDTCITKWNNASRFVGLGLKMRAHNPLFEDPG